MRFKLYRAIFLLFALLLIPRPEAQASHFMGIDIRMECINNCTTRVFWRAYRDCTGSAFLNNAVLYVPVTPGCNAPVSVTPMSTQITTEVTPVCPGLQTQCTNANATLNGVQEYFTFEDIDVCTGNPPGCDWNVEWANCCRNAIITSGAINQSFVVQNYHSLSQGCNNSPVYMNIPLFYACDSTTTTIQMGGYDPDGDSLVYSLEPCLQSLSGVNSSVTYNPGYSPTSPLGPNWNVALDVQTGVLTVAPSAVGGNVVGVLCIKTDEYRNGVLIGSNTRDIQVAILSCAANVPPSLGPVNNISGGAFLAAPDVVIACAGVPFCFDIEAFDPDTSSGQTVSLLWDASISSATFTETGNPLVTDTIVGNSPNGTFCWSNPTPGYYAVTFGMRDNSCPVQTYTDQVIYLAIGASNFTAPVVSNPFAIDTCLGTSVTLSVPGGPYTNFAWSTGDTTATITVNQPGNYGVTVSYVNGNCVSTGAGTISVGTTGTPSISGTVTLSNGTTPLQNAPVYLVTHDPILNALNAIDTVTTDSNGHYEFCSTFNADTVYLKAAPQLPAYPNHLPTYADTAIYWNNAALFLTSGVPLTVDWSVVPGSNPGGPGFIGGLITQGANKVQTPGDPMPDRQVFLYSTTLGQYIGTTVTDQDGYFSFTGIPLGDYEVSVDAPGVDEVNVPSLTLTTQNAVRDSLDFRLHTTYLELFVPTNIDLPLADSYFEVFPNPASGRQVLRLQLGEASFIQASVHDYLGRRVATLAKTHLEEGKHTFFLDELAAGTYFLKVQIGEAVKTTKIVRW